MNTTISYNRPYLWSGIVCLLIWTYIIWIYNISLSAPGNSCFFIQLFGIACPVCGGSHAIQAMAQGHWFNAFSINPLVTLIIIFAGIASVLILIDLLFNKKTWLLIVNSASNRLRSKKISLMLALLLIVHWYINILKYWKV